MATMRDLILAFSDAAIVNTFDSNGIYAAAVKGPGRLPRRPRTYPPTSSHPTHMRPRTLRLIKSPTHPGMLEIVDWPPPRGLIDDPHEPCKPPTKEYLDALRSWFHSQKSKP